MSCIYNLIKQGSPNDTWNRKLLLRDSLVEFGATCLFVYAGTLSALSTGDKLTQSEDVARILPIAIAFGVSILALVYSIGHLSGGHMNPGVSLLMYLRRQMSLKKMACYWVCQFLGAILGSALVWGSTSGMSGTTRANGLTVKNPPFDLGSTTLNTDSITEGNGFLLEFMGSTIFYFVISQTALDGRGVGHTGFPAIPIGLILVVVHICLIPFTGCGVNPARTLGPSAVVCMSDQGTPCSDVIDSWYWIYWIGPFLASFVVAEVTTLLQWNPVEEEDEEEEVKELEDVPTYEEEQKPQESALNV